MITSPIVLWGAAENYSSGWTTSGTITVTGGQTDPFGGTAAYSLNDTDAGVNSSRFKGGLTFVQRFGVVDLVQWVREGTSTSFGLALFDTTAGVTRGVGTYTWTAGVPVSTAANGGWQHVGTIQVGSWWLILGKATGVIEANQHRFEVLPAWPTVSQTGTLFVFGNRTVVLGVVDAPVTGPTPRAGYEQIQAPSGIEDAWSYGHDYELAFDAQWITTKAVGSPEALSGWDGQGEQTFAQCGVQAMLRALREKQLCTIIPAPPISIAYSGCYLKEPMEGLPGLKENGTRTLRLVFRHPSYPFQDL